jgi:hypothetical protein
MQRSMEPKPPTSPAPGRARLAGPAALLAAAVLLLGCAPAQPPDSVLLARFARHKPQFVQLQQMLVADHGPYMNRRYDTYENLRRELGIEKFVGNGVPPTGLRFPVATSLGTFELTHGSTKGYAWLPHPPEVLAAAVSSPSFGVTDDLDGQRLPRRPYIMALRHIEGPWYLYLDNDPFRPYW